MIHDGQLMKNMECSYITTFKIHTLAHRLTNSLFILKSNELAA